MTDLIVDSLAVYRLSRLIARDSFPPVAALRKRWYKRHPLAGQVIDAKKGMVIEHGEGSLLIGRVEDDAGYLSTFKATSINQDPIVTNGMLPPFYATGTALGELVDCSWCASMWVALGVIAARRYMPRVWGPVAKALAFSAVAGFVSQYERD